MIWVTTRQPVLRCKLAPVIGIGGSEMHLWAFRIDPSHTIAMAFRQLLSADEEGRTNGFRFAQLKNTFTICRGLLRLLLSRYLDVDPAAIEFDYRPKGKPVLRSYRGLDFNLSHTDGMMVCGVARSCELGVDIELLRPLSNMQELANNFFCIEEARELLSLPENQQVESFYRCWTQKEAYVKAIGEGLSAPLRSFRVSLNPADTAKFLHINGDGKLAQSWNLVELRLSDPYIAAAAYRGPERMILVRRQNDPLAFLKGYGFQRLR